MDPEKEKRIKEAVLKVCKRPVPQGHIVQRVKNKLAAEYEIFAFEQEILIIVASMIDYGELAVNLDWEIKIPDEKRKS